MVPNTRELLPEPETPVKTVSRRLGISTLTSLRLFSRAPSTRIRSWLSAAGSAPDCASVLVTVVIGLPPSGFGLHACSRTGTTVRTPDAGDEWLAWRTGRGPRG